MKVIYDQSSELFFKSFTANGGLLWTKEIKDALNLWDYRWEQEEQATKRMIAAWHGKSFSKTGLKVVRSTEL